MEWLKNFVHLVILPDGIITVPITTDGWLFAVKTTTDYPGLRSQIMVALEEIIAMDRTNGCDRIFDFNRVSASADSLGVGSYTNDECERLINRKINVVTRLANDTIVLSCDRFRWKDQFLAAQQTFDLLRLLHGFNLAANPPPVPPVPPKASDDHVFSAIGQRNQQVIGVRLPTDY